MFTCYTHTISGWIEEIRKEINNSTKQATLEFFNKCCQN